MADIMGLQGMMQSAEEAAKEREERMKGNEKPKSKTVVNTAPVSLEDASEEKAGAGGGAGGETGEGEPRDPKAIWDATALPEREEVEDEHDDRKRPEYEFLYKQDVGTEDVFLGLSDVDPSSTSCNFIVAKIKFPGCKIKDIDLDVTETRIIAQSPTLRLSTYLPHPVKHKDGAAKWDARRETLVVTLPIIRKDW